MLSGRQSKSRSRRTSGDHPRAAAKDRFKSRRYVDDRRTREDRAPTERRKGDERRKHSDRRQREEGFSREETERLEQMLASSENRRLLLRGTKVACPCSQGTLRLRRIADWKGSEPTWELRCMKCRRTMFTRQGQEM